MLFVLSITTSAIIVEWVGFLFFSVGQIVGKSIREQG